MNQEGCCFAAANSFPRGGEEVAQIPLLRLQGVLCWARSNHPELKGNAHEEKAQSPHRSSKEKDYSSFMLPFRQIITTLQRISHKDKMGTNPMPLARQHWQKELQPHLWRALVDDVLNSMGKAAEANSNQGVLCLIAPVQWKQEYWGFQSLPTRLLHLLELKGTGQRPILCCSQRHHLRQTPLLSGRQLIKISPRSAVLSQLQVFSLEPRGSISLIGKFPQIPWLLNKSHEKFSASW